MESFYYMSFSFYRSPFFYFFSVWIQNRQCCSVKFHTCCNIWFRKFSCCRLILKNGFQFYCFYFLSLIFRSHLNLLIWRYKTIWCCQFFYIISSKWQILLKNSFSIFTCYRFCKQFVCFYQYLIPCFYILFCVKTKLCSRKPFLIFSIFFHNWHFYFLAVIYKLCTLWDHWCILVCIDERNLLFFFI